MEQTKVESVEENPKNETKDSVDNVNPENPVEPEIEEVNSSTTHEIENISETILVDSMKIEPVVTEITTEILPIVVNDEETIPDSLGKDCNTNSQSSFEIEEQLLRVVGVEQSDSANIDTEVIEQNETLEDTRNEEKILPDLVKSDEPCDSEDSKPPIGIIDDTDQREESEENYVQESVIADESCDPSAMSVVEEIVMTSKSAYSVEIQEQDSTDSRENFITKDLVVLEVVSENEDTINVVEEHIQEIEIRETNEGDDGSGEKLQTEILISQVEDDEDEDNSQSSMEMELKDESTEVVNEDVKDVAILDGNEMENDTNEDKTAMHEVEDKSLVKSNDNHRSVIQEIVDDWIDDNIDDICDSKNNESDPHDSVEIELKTLLADDKPFGKDIPLSKDVNKFTNKILSQERVSGNLRNLRNNTEFTTKERVNGLENKPKAGKSAAASGETLSRKEIYSVELKLDKSGTSPMQDTTTSKQKQSSKLGQKLAPRHLSSQIASTAEVTQVLKERIKQKQQDVDLPQGGDILFVKKITQRLSSKLSGGSTQSFTEKKNVSKTSHVSSENYSNNSAVAKTMDDAEKIETADNRELLAILEGDVDPDWSNLKPHTENEATKSSEAPLEAIITAKLDPLTERELALKQLLELPTITVKKNTVKKRRTFKPAPSRVSTNIDLTTQESDAKQQTVSMVESEPVQALSPDDDDPPPRIDIVIQEEEMDFSAEDSHVEESRSGRKRKPTEKAREHEQNSVKKQKVYKGKVVDQKRTQKIESPMDELPQEYQEPPELDEYPKESEPPVPVENKPVGRNILSKLATTKNRNIYQTKSSKIGNKLPQNIGKRNMPVKKLLRQKGAGNVTNPKTVHMKSKFTPPQKKYRNTIKQTKVQKRLIDVPLGEIKPKKKSNEIDKLLQDEGVVNLLYDVEQPGRKRLVPITKSQTKVMDLHKVQRELKIRTKLVRNAVLRLRTSGASPTKISPRSKRGVSQISTPDSEGRENERNKSTRSSISSNPDFIIPAKIRNAADASVIVRRHSSSSFSSTSGSPRASIDGPDKQIQEASGSEERPVHVTRSSRRRYSQNEKNKQFAEVLSTPKKNGVNRKKSAEPADIENVVVSTEKNSVVAASRPNLRTDGKIVVEKTPKTSENIIDVGKSSNNESSGNKISTRSNGASVEREIIKTKKGTKTKAVRKDIVDTVMDIVEEDKLSACLAEAASALSNVDGNANQSGSTIVNRKLRASSILPKIIEKSSSEILDQFSNEEIQLRRHGNIVQIILTPSSTKLKNGFTLQIMNELSEVLLLLRKDEGCRVVLLTSTGTAFCEGLDLSNLIHENKEERRVHAEEMANGVKEFIKALAHFNKPIVAGIQGAAVGLGVTMLPLFDLVIASDKATFSTPYGQLGQIPEGAAILTLSQTVGNTVTSELLLGGRILTASEALRAGLVTRVLWPDRFQGELIPSLRSMSENSSQSMEATKTLLRHSLRKKLDAALDSESYLLIQHWCSAECQTLIKSYLDGEGAGGH